MERHVYEDEICKIEFPERWMLDDYLKAKVQYEIRESWRKLARRKQKIEKIIKTSRRRSLQNA